MGKVAVVENMDQPFQIQRSLAVIRPRHDMTLPELLATQMRSEYFQNLLWQSTGFSAQPGIYLGALADFPVPIPPAAQKAPLVQKIQQRSAQVSSLVSHVEKHIDRLREYRSSLISAAVTGQLNIDEFQARQLEAA
jgi:type I restriction enzyme S subunit